MIGFRQNNKNNTTKKRKLIKEFLGILKQHRLHQRNNKNIQYFPYNMKNLYKKKQIEKNNNFKKY